MRRFLSAFFLVLSLSAQAEEHQGKCTAHFETYEREYDLPKNILSSVSLTETGRWNKTNKTLGSWPWTVNHSGKSYFFNNKNEAVEFVSSLIIKGYKNIDVGCMQVNLKHHPFAFENLYQAFEPKYNVAYAASLIKKLYVNSDSWVSAIARYHSGDKQRGINYATKVLKQWHNKSDESNRKPNENLNASRKIFRMPGRNPLRLKNDKASIINSFGKT